MTGRPNLQFLEGGKAGTEPRSAGTAWHPSQGRRQRVVLYISGDVDHPVLLSRLAWRWAKVSLIVANGGNVGYHRAVERQPSVVIVDAALPDLEARFLVARMRRRVVAPNTPIIVLAHVGTPKEREQFIWAGATAYVSDTSDPVQIDRTLGMLLEVSAWR